MALLGQKTIYWVTLALVLLDLTSIGEGVKQELWVNFKGGNSLYFDTHTPDLTKYSALLEDAEAICTVGTWMTFLETNYEHHFDSFGLGSVPTCNVASGVFKNTKSLRHYAANETDTDALSIYAGTYYNGTEIYVTARAYTGITERQGSVAASGHTSWMLYEGQNLDGFSVCFQVPREPKLYFNYNRLVFMDMATVGSVFKGCDEREIQAYKKLHLL